MKQIDVGSLRTKIAPQHYEVFGREIWGPDSGGKNVAVALNFMLAHGGAEMHTHPQSEHIFYVLSGELKVYDGKETMIVSAGQGLVIGANEPHQVTGTGRMDCQYMVVTSPPPNWVAK